MKLSIIIVNYNTSHFISQTIRSIKNSNLNFKKITMRVMDFYLHHEGLIRENWVPIDIAHILDQIGIDIFKLIHKK